MQVNPNVHNLRNTMCFKTWNDIIISLPNRTVKWCCKTQTTEDDIKQTTFDLDTLDLDFLFKHPILQKRQYELSGGTQCEDCVTCWESERKSGSSYRTIYNSNYDFMLNRRMEKTKNHPHKAIEFHKQQMEADRFQFIEIELTNKCNMACAYCWAGNSTRWQKEMKTPFPDTDDLIFDRVVELLNEYWETTLHKKDRVNFSLLGGEPFFTDHMYRFIEDFMVNLNDNKRSGQHIIITITTNLNFPEKKFKQFIELVERTPNITYALQLSGEALGRQSELVRWGLNYETWDKNIDLFFTESKRLKNLQMGFGCAHNALTLPYFKSFLEYINDKVKLHDFNNNQIIMHHNYVERPEHLSIAMLDPKHAKAVDEQIEYIKNEMQDVKFYKRDGFINMMKSLREQVAGNEVTEFMKRDATTEFNMLQNRRNINFIEHFPHFHELIRK